MMLKKGRDEKISSTFYKLRKRDKYKEKKIYEIILLSDKGELVAHSHVEKLAKSYINPEYNKPVFHKALHLARGSVEVNAWKKGNNIPIPSLLPMYDGTFRNLLAPSLKFSTPITASKKIGKKKRRLFSYSLHVIINRVEMRRAVDDFSYNAVILLFVSMLIAFIFSMILLLIFNSQLKHLSYFGTAQLTSMPKKKPAPVPGPGLKPPETVMPVRYQETVMPDPGGKLLPKKKIDYYRQKLDDEKKDKKIKDAIFIDENA